VYFAQFKDGTEGIEVHPEDHSSYKWFSENELAGMLVGGKTEDDEEYKLIKQAFSLLSGVSPRF
jgi:hypothetical protein